MTALFAFLIIFLGGAVGGLVAVLLLLSRIEILARGVVNDVLENNKTNS